VVPLSEAVPCPAAGFPFISLSYLRENYNVLRVKNTGKQGILREFHKVAQKRPKRGLVMVQNIKNAGKTKSACIFRRDILNYLKFDL
jgi:hypothetical protein